MAKSGGNSTLILLAVGGAAAYYAYTQGWFSSLFPSTAVAAAAAVPVAAAAPIVQGSVTSGPFVAAAPIPITTLPVTPASSLVSQLQAVASQPGNVALSPTGGSTYSGWQWDAIAKQALGSAYVNLSQLPTIAGATQYTLAQYLAAYPASDVSGLGRTVVYFPRRGTRIVLPRNYHLRGA